MHFRGLLRDIRGTRSSERLDVVRALAALEVMCLHLRDLFFVDYPQLDHPTLWLTAPYALANYGHQAVVIFFVLSGFFIAGTVARSTESGRWSWREYLIQRVARLGVVLAPALVLTYLLDTIGLHLFGFGHNYVGDGTVYILSPNLIARRAPRIFLANLLFLQSFIAPTFGTDSPLWSLSYEFWFYIVFPFLYLAIRPQGKTRWLALLPGLGLFLGLTALRHGFSAYFLVWLFGAFAGSSETTKLPTAARRAIACAGVAGSILALWAVWRGLCSILITDYALGLSFSLVLFAIISDTRKSLGGPVTRLFGRIAQFSYTLYAIHLPILFLARCFLIGNGPRMFPTASSFVIALGIGLGTLLVSYLISLITESRTDAVRRAMRSLLTPTPPVAPLLPPSDQGG